MVCVCVYKWFGGTVLFVPCRTVDFKAQGSTGYKTAETQEKNGVGGVSQIIEDQNNL